MITIGEDANNAPAVDITSPPVLWGIIEDLQKRVAVLEDRVLPKPPPPPPPRKRGRFER